MLNRELYAMFLRRNARLTAGVAAGAGLLGLLLTVLFPGMDPEASRATSSSWPAIMKGLFGDPARAFADVYAWLNMEVFHITYWAIHGAFAAILASRLIAREREERTLEMLLAYPVTRACVLLSGLAGVATLVTLSVLPFTLGLGAGVVAKGLPLRAGLLLSAVGAGLLLSLFCAAVTAVASAVGAGQTLCAFCALGVVSLCFLYTSVLTRLVPALEVLAFLSPFHVYRTEAILVGGSPDPAVLWLLAYVAAPTIAAFVIFSRRELV